MEGSRLPLVTPGLVYGTALPPPDEDAGDLCRICFGPDESDATGNPADQFISPCKCSGKLQCIYAGSHQDLSERVPFIMYDASFTCRPAAHVLQLLITGCRLHSAHPLLMSRGMAAAALRRAGLQALTAVRDVSRHTAGAYSCSSAGIKCQPTRRGSASPHKSCAAAHGDM